MVHGHWDVKESDLNQPRFVHDRKLGVNSGIGIVIPAIKILETIHHPLLEQNRAAAEEMYRLGIMPKMD
jgi:hypothetical protein